MPRALAARLQETVERETAALARVTDEEAAAKPAVNGWSKKEELGHLIDSATNNHVRFVRASLEPGFRGEGYAQERWVELHGYAAMPWVEIVELWRRYNGLLVELVRRIPEDRLERPCTIGDSAPVTLRFLIEDYVGHMQHHLDHILKRV
ncbi:MAG TPA: DinB family protein [Bryobacteraceae bacterium]|nr:DinB family protein [Bryobacteraceae bacterium]